jgi:Flp pilus assembly protein TadB
MLGGLDVLLAVVGGAIAAGGLVLLVVGIRGLPQRSDPKPRSGRSAQDLLQTGARQIVIGVVVGLLVLVLTRWIVAAVAIGVLAFLWPALFGATKTTKTDMARLEALATWTESLRDTIAGAVGLEQAIPASVDAAPDVLRRPLRLLVNRLRTREPLPSALVRFADDLDDPSADLIVAALVLNARLRGPGLREVLSQLSTSAREELDMRRRVEAQRRATRRSVRIVILVVLLFAGGLVVLNRPYLAPYDGVFGQAVLALVIGLFAIGFVWLRRLANFDEPGRFLSAENLVRDGVIR